jgi:DNA mismatch repair protein MutS2
LIYPADFEEVTGFARLREMLADLCRYESTQALVRDMQLLHTESLILRMYDETDEWKKFREVHPAVADKGAIKDIHPWLSSLDIENFFFDEDELFVMLEVLDAYAALFPVLQKNKENFPVLCEILGALDGISTCRDIIRAVIDPKAKLLAYASPAYGKLGAEIERMEKDARQVARNMFRVWRDAGYTAETDITVRDERLVVPIQAEFKRKVQGFVKDVSATGKVIYIEPLESLELNNRLTELYAEKRRERERILRLTTAKLRPQRPALAGAMSTLVAFDFIRVRVDLANKLSANRPGIKNAALIELKQAVNPLLWLKNKPAKKPTVPMNLHLDETDRIMVISGPNAGGKSISLKTAMLLQYMGQCGLFVTANPESTIGVFQNLSIDCGDGQSIEDGLSTFSAHLQHLKKMTTIAAKRSFFAIDELGDGTDPRFGGPIAQAILEEMLASGAIGVVTTHYSRLKEWASQTRGVVNASMAYDTRELKPLYQLVSGKPGSSFALELMRKTGFDARTIERVQGLSGEESGRTEDLLMDLSAKQLDLNDILEENIQKQKQLELLLSEYSILKEKINSRKKDILDAARSKAEDLLKEANKQIELTIRTIREHGANPEKTKQAREKLRNFEQKKVVEKQEKNTEILQSSALEIAGNQPKKKTDYKPGMQIRNLLNASKGEVLEVKKDKLLAAFGLLKMWVPLSEVEPLEKEKAVKHKKAISGYDWVARQSEFRVVLDLRGVGAEDALKKVQNWLDEAYALGQNNLKIIHGRGDGILRKALREFFKTLNYVKAWRSEHEEQGGDGCTIVELN